AVGEAYRYAGQPDKAAEYYLEGLQLVRDSSESKKAKSGQEYTFYNNLALTEFDRNNLEEARKYLDLQFGWDQLSDFDAMQLETNYCHVLVLEKMGLGDSARRHSERMYELAKERKLPRFQSMYSDWLVKYLKENGQPGKALSYLEATIQLKELRRVEQAKIRVALYEVESETNSLRAQTQVLEAEKKMQTYVSLALGAGLVLILAFTWLLARNNRRMKRLNALLDQKNKRLDDANREINGLISVVAHDLRAPIIKVQSLADMIRQVEVPGEKTQAYWDWIDKVLDGGSNLIRDILTISAIENEREAVAHEAVNLTELLRLSADTYQESADKKAIQIHVEGPNKTEIQTEKVAFGRILDNLLSNAIKFSPRERNVFLRLQPTEAHVTLTVQDEGPGISEEDQKKMFRKFQKLSARPTAGESSTGLGLAIIKTLVEQLGGNISVESAPGKGTAFHVRLPRKSA
ncbi:MAG: HAMP domain-containing sensor histidine kinase, partial [Bacteroidota bacterium]